MKRMLTLTSLFVLAGLAGAQAPSSTSPENVPNSPFSAYGLSRTQAAQASAAAKKSALEAAIDLALAHNPDLRVAEAKVREAEASMSRARLQVLQKVVAAYQGVEDARASVKYAEQKLHRASLLAKSRGVSVQEVTDAEAAVAAAKSKLAAAQAELDYLQGKAASKKAAGYPQEFARTADPALAQSLYRLGYRTDLASTASAPYVDAVWFTTKARLEGPAADRLRKALKANMSAAWGGSSVREVLAELRKVSGVHIQASENGPAWEEKVTAKLENVPLSAVLQLLEDVLGEHRIVVRDYGLLIVTKSHVPPGATTLADFLREGAKADPNK